ncbi:MAG: hypothetical protein Q8M08_12555 [Bacteroidales bacterium]|nr:hypothetical protein [Bacteroidales bacterium]
MAIQDIATKRQVIKQVFGLFTLFLVFLPSGQLFAQSSGVVVNGGIPGTPVQICIVKAIQKGNRLKIKRHPGFTSLSDTILISGNGQYNVVRVNLVSLVLTGKDTTGKVNDSCLPCYAEPQSMASIIGGGLSEFSTVISNYPGSIPTKMGHNPLELVLTTQSPKSFISEPLFMQFNLPGASTSSKCHVIADMFLEITLRDINCLECVIPLTISFDLYSGELLYAELKDQLDGSYFPAVQGKVNFKYIERYAIPEGKNLTYSIFNKRRQQIKNEGEPNPGMPALPISQGANFLNLDLTKVKDMNLNEFYVLEVQGDKKDKFFLRFRFLK